jgi:hypothetical protein
VFHVDVFGVDVLGEVEHCCHDFLGIEVCSGVFAAGRDDLLECVKSPCPLVLGLDGSSGFWGIMEAFGVIDDVLFGQLVLEDVLVGCGLDVGSVDGCGRGFVSWILKVHLIL